MDTKFKKIFNYVIAGFFAACMLWSGTAAVYYRTRYNNTAESLAECMEQLELARQRNEQYADTYKRARVTNRELGESLSRCTGSLSELRVQLGAIEKSYTEMENLLNSAGNYDSNAGNNNDSDNSIISE